MMHIIALKQLRKHRGKYVPCLLAAGTTFSGSALFIATELIYGYTLGTGEHCHTCQVAVQCPAAL